LLLKPSHGYAPSFEEIGKGLKLTSLATVHKHITTLEKKGFIRRGYNQSRSIEIVQLPKSVKTRSWSGRSKNFLSWGGLRRASVGSRRGARDAFTWGFCAWRQFVCAPVKGVP